MGANLLACPDCVSNILKTSSLLHDPSPVADMLDTNARASRSQCILIEDIISDATKEISQAEDDISRLQVALKQRVRQRDELKRYSKRHSALLSLVRDLPHEIISEIFLHSVHLVAAEKEKTQRAMDRVLHGGFLSVPDPRTAPMVLG